MPPDISHLLVHRADVERIVPVSLGNGRYRDDYAAHLSGIKFRLSQGSSSEQTEGQQWITRYGPVGYALPDADIKRMDIVTNIVREDGTTDTERYRVTGVHRPSLTQHIRIGLEVVQKQASA
jgi:hypothetical protein